MADALEAVPGARPVRDEDAFDTAAVEGWLATVIEPVSIDDVRQFSGGASNLTYLLRTTTRGGTRGTGATRDLILRRPPAGTKARGAHDMGREFRIQSALAPVFPYIAPMIGHCEDEGVIGSEFYVMERVVGSIPRMDFTQALSESQVRDVCTHTLDLLVALHGVDPAAAGLDGLGKGEGYVARQVSGWIERYRKVVTPNVGDWELVMAWLAEHQPTDVGQCLIHNDFRFDNIVYDEADPTRPVALLDWELATVGDPLMDLGSSLAYWIEAGDDEAMQLLRMQPTTTPGMLTRAEVKDYYCERAGLTVTPEQWTFYEVFGLFRLAGIAQQIYYRFHHGQTTNKRFEVFWMMVNVLEERARALIGAEPAGHVEGL